MNNSARKNEMIVSDYKDIVYDYQSVKSNLTIFIEISSTPWIFWRYGILNREQTKTSLWIEYDKKNKPKQVRWGSGSRAVDFNELLFVAYGHPNCDTDDETFFCIIGKQRSLNLQSKNKYVTKLWVKGICRLIGHTEEKSKRLYMDLRNKNANWSKSILPEIDADYDSSDDEAHVRFHLKKRAASKR